jgi:hypothetical protein
MDRTRLGSGLSGLSGLPGLPGLSGLKGLSRFRAARSLLGGGLAGDAGRLRLIFPAETARGGKKPPLFFFAGSRR